MRHLKKAQFWILTSENLWFSEFISSLWEQKDIDKLLL